MIIRKSLLLLIGLSVVMVLQACTNTDKRVASAIGLKTTKDVFVATATSAKRLCEQDILSQGDCEEIEDLYNKGRILLLSAKTIWDTMVEIDSFNNGEVYSDLIIEIIRITTEIEIIIRKAGI